MSVLLENFEMPKDDDILLAHIHSDGSVSYVYANEDVPSLGKAVGLPADYGDLIDRDALLEKVRPRGIADDVWKESYLYKILSEAPMVLKAVGKLDDKEYEEN